MASSGNFMTFMPSLASVTLANGNTKATGDGGNFDNPYCTFAFDVEDTDGFYWEWRVGATDGATAYGISKAEINAYTNVANPTFGFYHESGTGYAMQGDGAKRASGVNSSYGGSTTSGNKVVGIAVRKGKIYFSIDGTFQNSGDPVNETGEAFSGLTGFFTPTFALNGSNNGILNAGQDSTFSGNESAGGNADANGFGDFHTAPPTGFKALCSANLPISDDIDPAQTSDDIPTKQFGVVTYAGNGGSNAITGLGFQPDLVWFKNRTSTADYSNALVDSSRGRTKVIYSHSTRAELTSPSNKDLVSFDSDGFTLGTNEQTGANNGSSNYVAWCWRCAGGTTSSNSDGSTTSTVQANTKAGFSIITYAGNGSNRTIGHGLSSAPDFIIIKNRDASSNWVVYSRAMGAANRGQINTTNAWGSSSTSFQSTDPTSSVISLGTSSGTNANGNNFVCYAWHSVEGFSSFGSFEGNSNADGPFIYTGFRPRLVFCKAADATENWQVRDTERSTFNANSQVRIYWNSSAAEGSASTASPIDFLSNGFKVRGSNSEINSNTIVYGAWGDVPFKYNNTF